MATNLPLPPPGFDDLSPEDQIDYVQTLWDRIAARPDQVPVPDWHREVIRQRMADQQGVSAEGPRPAEGRPWDDVRDEIRGKLKGRKTSGQ